MGLVDDVGQVFTGNSGQDPNSQNMFDYRTVPVKSAEMASMASRVAEVAKKPFLSEEPEAIQLRWGGLCFAALFMAWLITHYTSRGVLAYAENYLLLNFIAILYLGAGIAIVLRSLYSAHKRAALFGEKIWKHLRF